MWVKACFPEPVFFFKFACFFVLMYDANYLNNGNQFFDSLFSLLK